MIEKTKGGIYEINRPLYVVTTPELIDVSQKIDDYHTLLKSRIYVPNKYAPKKRLTGLKAAAAGILLSVAGCSSIPKGLVTVEPKQRTKQEQVEKPTPEPEKAIPVEKVLIPPQDYIGNAVNIQRPNHIEVRGTQSYMPKSEKMTEHNIHREVIVNLEQKLSNLFTAREWFYNNHADFLRDYGKNGGSNVCASNAGAGIYITPTDWLSFGAIAETSQNEYTDTAKVIERTNLAGLSVRLTGDKLRLELNAIAGKGKGEYKDETGFKKDKEFQANLIASYLIPNTRLAIRGEAEFGRSEEEHKASSWHLMREGGRYGIGPIISFPITSGIEGALQASYFEEHYKIRPDSYMRSNGASLAFLWRLLVDEEKGINSQSVLDFYIQAWIKQNYSNQPIKGFTEPGKSNQEIGGSFGGLLRF